MVRRRVVVLLALLALCLPPAFAQNARQMRSEVEASMLVTGTVDIEHDGAVASYAIDQEDKLPSQVTSLVHGFVPQMRFEPVLNEQLPGPARAKMTLLMVAVPDGQDQMRIAIRSAYFDDDMSADESNSVRAVDLRPPPYPRRLVAMGGKGTVYLLVQVMPDGSAGEVAAEQVNLTVLGNARQMTSVREALAKAAIGATARWQFGLPTDQKVPDRGYWIVRVPVEFSLLRPGQRLSDPDYGRWTAYHPGPRSSPAWAEPDPPGFSPDVLLAGGVYAAQSRFRLLTPLEG